jgi:hypothetical protein
MSFLDMKLSFVSTLVWLQTPVLAMNLGGDRVEL